MKEGRYERPTPTANRLVPFTLFVARGGRGCRRGTAQVERWLLERAADEGPHAGRERLEFFNGEHVARVLATPGSVLGDLRKVCRPLETTYGWSGPAAVLFVLTGTTLGRPERARQHPPHASVQSTLTHHYRGRSADSPSTSPGALLGCETAAAKGRDKDILPKHAALAVFAAEQGLRASQGAGGRDAQRQGTKTNSSAKSPAYASWLIWTQSSRPDRRWAVRRCCRSGTNAIPSVPTRTSTPGMTSAGTRAPPGCGHRPFVGAAERPRRP